MRYRISISLILKQILITKFLNSSHTFSFLQLYIIPYNFQFSNRCNDFKYILTLKYIVPQDFNYAFFIRGMGLFFLHLSVDHKGGLLGTTHIVNSNEVARQFAYTLKVGNGPQGVRYMASVRPI